jgi:hypothetical protein
MWQVEFRSHGGKATHNHSDKKGSPEENENFQMVEGFFVQTYS